MSVVIRAGFELILQLINNNLFTLVKNAWYPNLHPHLFCSHTNVVFCKFVLQR